MDSVSYRCGDIYLDVSNRRFTRGDTEVDLEPKVFSVIVQLVSRAGTLVTRNQLLDAIWGHRYVSASAINRIIVLARRAFADDSDEPRFIRTVHGVGYRYVGPVDSAGSTLSERVAPFAPPAVARLPARIDSLIGREAELATLLELLSGSRAVTVIGAGGIGKTQFALEAARKLAPSFPDGVWFFDLASMKDAEEWLRTLAAVISVSAERHAERVDRVCQVFQSRQVLLLLDNCDRIAEGVGAILFELLRATERAKVVSTTQVALNFRGEQLLRLPPLGVPEEAAGEGVTDLRRLASVPAVAMLLVRIRASQPGFELTTANAAAIASICRRLDGLPLALELAAARFALLSAEQVLERLEQRFRFLKSDTSGRDPRHRTLQALLDWSFALLSNEERRVLGHFSVFVQGWTVETAIALAQPLGIEPEGLVELLGGLANKSLVSASASFVPPRYQLLESVRDYALEQLRIRCEEAQARAAHLQVLARMTSAAHADMVGGRMPERIESMVPEKGNIIAALECALCTGELETALAIVGDLAIYIKASGMFELGPICGRVIQCTAGLQTSERARALLCVGLMAFYLQQPRPECHLLEASRLAGMFGDTWTEAYAAGYCALCLANGYQQHAAAAQAAVVQQIAQRSRDPLLTGLAGLAHGWICLAHGENDAAIEVLGSVRDLGEDLHQRHFIDMYIGLAQFRTGKLAEAAARWLDAMNQAARVGHRRGIAGSVEGCAYLAEQRGAPETAARLIGVAQAIRERSEIPLFQFWRAHHAATAASLKAQLGHSRYEEMTQAARRELEEDVFDEVRALLMQYQRGRAGTAGRASAPRVSRGE